MNKYEVGLERIELIAKSKERYKDLLKGLEDFNKILIDIGYNSKVKRGPRKITQLIENIFYELNESEFLEKDKYCSYFKELKNIDDIFYKGKEACRVIGSDFCSLELCEFIWLGIDLLQIGTYDNIICPDYPSTEEIFSNGSFSYYEQLNSDKEIIIDSIEKCWDFLKKSYDDLDN